MNKICKISTLNSKYSKFLNGTEMNFVVNSLTLK